MWGVVLRYDFSAWVHSTAVFPASLITDCHAVYLLIKRSRLPDVAGKQQGKTLPESFKDARLPACRCTFLRFGVLEYQDSSGQTDKHADVGCCIMTQIMRFLLFQLRCCIPLVIKSGLMPNLTKHNLHSSTPLRSGHSEMMIFLAWEHTTRVAEIVPLV